MHNTTHQVLAVLTLNQSCLICSWCKTDTDSLICVSQVSGAAPPKPCTSFAHFSFDEQLMHQIRKSEYTQPTPIQCQVRHTSQDHKILKVHLYVFEKETF